VDCGGGGIKASVLDCEGNIISRAVRTPTPGTHPAYVESLRRLIEERVENGVPADLRPGRESVCAPSASGQYGWFDECEPGCCKPGRGAEKPVIAEYCTGCTDRSEED